MSNGFFISFEGVDGTGKSTHVKLLSQYLTDKGLDLYVTKEPGDANSGSKLGPGIRSILFGTPGTKNMGPGVADFLFLADHWQNTYDIQQALDDGKIVISDRYADSQFAYAAAATRKATAWSNEIYERLFGPIPDLTLLFVVRGPITHSIGFDSDPLDYEDISWALTRANARRGTESGKQDGKSWNDTEEQRKIQRAYLINLDKQNRLCEIDIWEKDSIDDIFAKVKAAVHAKFEEEGIYLPEG